MPQIRDRRARIRWRLNAGGGGGVTQMDRNVAIVLYVVAMAAVIVGVDFAFLIGRFWGRLTANIGIVVVFAAFYQRFVRQ